MIKATEVKMIVAPRMAPPLPFGSLSRKLHPSDPVSLHLSPSLHLSHLSPLGAPLSQVAPSSKHTGDFWPRWWFHITGYLVTACGLQAYLDFVVRSPELVV